MNKKDYSSIVTHYENCLQKYGDTHLGVDWPNPEDANTRYRIMLEVIKTKSDFCTLLDFGCGTSYLYDYIIKNNITGIQYQGLDISEKFINCSQQKFPDITYYCLDILEHHEKLPEFDYIIMNGVFTEKRDVSFETMFNYFQNIIKILFPKAKIGIAFNVMSKQVDWEREDLFHLPLDTLANFLTKEISRNFIIRNDYKLYEYTSYVYH